jgi:hypothetical protein
MPLMLKVLSFARRSILRLALRKDVVVRTWPTKKEDRVISEHTNRFIEAYIRTTEWIRCEFNFRRLRKAGFDAYIVGSDQVWRPKYAPELKNHFLGFAGNSAEIRKIAYAASFGVDKWEFSGSQTKNCSMLLKQFNAVSVREDTGIALCKDYLGVSATQTLDPTLLLSREDYAELTDKVKLPGFQHKLVIYVLDMSEEKKKILKKVNDILKIDSASIMPEAVFRDAGPTKVKSCIFPPVENWIRGFYGCLFRGYRFVSRYRFFHLIQQAFSCSGKCQQGNDPFRFPAENLWT